ncbi:MAG: hypothetical protein IKR02_00290 [Firmicutes bacterium]|nr:hypothetical protein [Bacillota bacterium]
MKIDSELGQAELDLPVCLTSSLKAGETLKSGGFLLQISSRACDTSYRKGLDQLNSDSHRDELGCAVSLSTYSYTVIKLGCDLAAQKAEQAEDILEQYGFVDGQWPDGKELPDTMRQEEGLFEAFDPAELDAFSFNLDEAEDWPTVFCCQEEDAGEISEKAEAGEDSKGENAEHAQEKKKKGSYSKPDMRPRDHLKKRRTRKQCIQDDEKRMEFMKAYALWLNTQDCTALKKILHEVMVESKLEKTIYISIDGVCVSEQEAPRVKGGRPTEKEKGTWIDHWNIRVEFGDRSYLITDPDLDSCFRQLLAFLLKHSLLSHAFVFLADGQDSIFLGVRKYFKHWRFLFILDFYHLAEKCYNLLSLGLKSYRVPSPWEKPEYYKTGKKKGQVKSQKKTSISRVYASTIVSYLWYGNVKEAVSYLENLDPADISDQEAINKLIGYFRKRKEFITCYAMRRAAGLRNSSNGVEGANNLLVSARQKEDDRMHWRQKGSWALAALTCARKNGDLEDWCVNRRFSFSKQAWTNGQEYEAAA